MWSSVDYIRGRTMFARIASRVLNLSTRQCMKPSQIDARSFARLCLPERQTLTSKMKLTSNLAPSPLSLPAWRHMSSQTTTRRPRKNSKKISTPEGKSLSNYRDHFKVLLVDSSGLASYCSRIEEQVPIVNFHPVSSILASILAHSSF